MREALDRAVERANQAVSRAESIRRYTVLTTDFTVENDYLTPSLKVKRARVVTDFTDVIEELYRGHPPARSRADTSGPGAVALGIVRRSLSAQASSLRWRGRLAGRRGDVRRGAT